MLTRFFLKLTDYAVFRRLLWKPIYELLAKRFRSKDWSFMNYGYAPASDEQPIVLQAKDEINRYPIQMYHHLATQINLEARNVLEVGSGRGGGIAYLKEYLKPATITGLDIAGNAVAIAQKYFGSAGIEFVEGDAEKLSFNDETFDVVINVESSHTYGSIPVFLAEVKRVLRPGGHLLCADIRTAAALPVFKQLMHTCGLQVINEQNISDNVRLAIELEEPVKQKRIHEHIPKNLQPIFRQFAGVQGSKAHTQLLNGELVYYRFVLQKPL